MIGVRWNAAGLVLALLCGLPVGALAEPQGAATQWIDGAPTEAELATLGSELVSGDEGKRNAAYRSLSRLPTTALPNIRARLVSLQRSRISAEQMVAALTAFRRAVGSTRADDEVDLAPGIVVVTATQPTSAVAVTAELILLLRALEAMDVPEAGVTIAEGLVINPDALAQEAVRIRTRMGMRLVPALIELRGHPSQDIRRWASRGLRVLEITDPAVATAREADPQQLAAILRAYGKTHDLEALGPLVSLLNDPRIQVRSAAREAVRNLGRNAIWKLRVAFQEVTGKSADARWSAEKTLEELCVLFDRERIERAETALALGLNAHLAGDLLLMTELFESALRADPRLARRAEMGPGYGALGDAKLANDELGAAEAAYRRALRLAPAHAQANRWRAQLSYVQAERALARGIVDLPGYKEALALAHEHAPAADAVDRLSGAWSERAERNRRVVAVIAIMVLCACGLGVLRLRRNTALSDEPPETLQPS